MLLCKLTILTNPKGFRGGGSGPKGKILKEIKYAAHDIVLNDSWEHVPGLDYNVLKNILAYSINLYGKGYKSFFSDQDVGYETNNKKHIIVTDNDVTAFKKEFNIVQFPRYQSTYDIAQVMYQQLEGLVQSMFFREMFPIKFSFVLFLM